MAVRGSAWRAAINCGDDCVPHHVRVHLSDVAATGVDEMAQTEGGAAPVHLPVGNAGTSAHCTFTRRVGDGLLAD
jgi:hypothetical protein